MSKEWCVLYGWFLDLDDGTGSMSGWGEYDGDRSEVEIDLTEFEVKEWVFLDVKVVVKVKDYKRGFMDNVFKLSWWKDWKTILTANTTILIRGKMEDVKKYTI